MAGSVVLALVRRGSNAKAVTAEKNAKTALDVARGFQAEIATLKDYSEEHEARINDLDERVSNTDPHLRPRDDRLSKLEAMITEEKAAREARHREQARRHAHPHGDEPRKPEGTRGGHLQWSETKLRTALRTRS